LIILAFISIYNYKSYQIIAVAPTGKAADRISESVNENISKFISLIKDSVKNKDWTDLNIDDIKIESITIHRLLKGSEMSLSFLHNRENKVKYKVVIVDEASMIDIPLMAKLLDALDEDTSLILSGDANQLSSVEAGRVFSDLKEFLYDIGEKQRSNIIELTKSFRYKEDSIVEKAKDILYKILNVKDDNEKDILADDFIRLLKEKQRILEQEVDIRLFENLSKKIVEFNETKFNDEIKNQLLLLRKLKFLSPLRLSKYGTYNINRMYARYLKTQGETGFIPIIITKNNYQLKLFNGDIGIIKKKDDDIYAYFEDEGKDSSLKEIALSLLSNWEPAYCLTVHKSQGSEFDTIVLFLPENVENFEFITLELLYTAITRAKEDFYIVSNHKSLKQVMLKRSKRFTGLYDKLKELII
jgi:exodeoxyribonuclease V alpha subunit